MSRMTAGRKAKRQRLWSPDQVGDDRQKTKKEHSAMRWRGYKRQDKDPGSIKTLDPRLRMSGTSVEDDSRKKGKKAKTLEPRSEPVLDVCNRGSEMTDKDKKRTQRHEMACLFPLPARRLVFWFFIASPCRRTFFSICSGSILCCLQESAMRHVPGFDQGWRGYKRQKKDSGSPIRSGMTDKKQRRGNDAGSSINNVEDDRQRKNTAP